MNFAALNGPKMAAEKKMLLFFWFLPFSSSVEYRRKTVHFGFFVELEKKRGDISCLKTCISEEKLKVT